MSRERESDGQVRVLGGEILVDLVLVFQRRVCGVVDWTRKYA